MSAVDTPAVGSRWRHSRNTDPLFDLRVIAVVEHDGAWWVVSGAVEPCPAVMA